jgi:hypothetical protein
MAPFSWHSSQCLTNLDFNLFNSDVVKSLYNESTTRKTVRSATFRSAQFVAGQFVAYTGYRGDSS